MSKNYSPSIKAFPNSEESDFDPSKINVFLDIAEYDIIPKLTKYITLNGGVLLIRFNLFDNYFFGLFRNLLLS